MRLNELRRLLGRNASKEFMNTKQAGGVAVSGHLPNPSPPVLRLYEQRDPPCSAGCNTRIRTAFIRDALAARDSGFRRKLRLMIARIRSNLPIYILAGDNDPINHHLEWLKPLVQRYRRAVLRDVTEKYYPGGRHEMLNEINRDQVLKDFLSWSRRVCA